MTKVSKFISEDGTVRIASVVSSELISDVLPKGMISPLAATILGRATTAAVLMATYQKEGQTVGLHFRGDGPLGEVFAEASFDGKVRAYCGNNQANLPDGESKIGAGVGRGILEVVHSQPFQKSSHKGLIKIESGEIGDDIAQYYDQSHQTPTIVALSVMPSASGCEWAGGYLVELMPGHSDDTLNVIEEIQGKQPAIGDIIASGGDADDLVSGFVTSLACRKLEHSVIMKHYCNCSLDRISNSLRSFGVKTLKEMVAENKVYDVICQFCGKLHHVTAIQVQKALSSLRE